METKLLNRTAWAERSSAEKDQWLNKLAGRLPEGMAYQSLRDTVGVRRQACSPMNNGNSY